MNEILGINKFTRKLSAEENQRDFEGTFGLSLQGGDRNYQSPNEQSTSDEDEHSFINLGDISSSNIFDKDEPQSDLPHDSQLKSDPRLFGVHSICLSPGLKLKVPYKPENIIYVGDLEKIFSSCHFEWK